MLRAAGTAPRGVAPRASSDDPRCVNALLHPAGRQVSRERLVIDQPDPGEPVECPLDRLSLEASPLQALTKLQPRPRSRLEQPEGCGMCRLLGRGRAVLQAAASSPDRTRAGGSAADHSSPSRSPGTPPTSPETSLGTPPPSCALTFSSISRASSGLSRRKLRAFSRPCPS